MADTVGVSEARADEGKATPKVKASPAPTQKDFDAFKASINQTVTQLQTENATLRSRADVAEAATRDWEDYPDDPDKRRESEVKRAADRIYGDKLAELEQEKLALKARELRLEYQGLPPDLFMGVGSSVEMENKALRWAADSGRTSTESSDANPEPEPTATPGTTTGLSGSQDTKVQITAIADGDAPFDAKEAAALLKSIGV